jgi:hypothetical protein
MHHKHLRCQTTREIQDVAMRQKQRKKIVNEEVYDLKTLDEF